MSLRAPLAVPCHEDLSRLARENPLAFERLRRQLIDSLIASAPERNRPRLRGIQFQVECLRRLSRSALGSTVRVYDLMWESFLELNRSCQQLAEQGDRLGAGKAVAAGHGQAPLRDAQILEFRARPLPPPKLEGAK